MNDKWDFTVAGYRGATLLVETGHRGVSSMETEVAVWKARMKRGEVDKIIVKDLRSKEQREQHGFGPWSKDLTQIIHSTIKENDDER